MYDIDISDIEARWEEYFMFPAFKKAVEYLKGHKIIKSDSDIATKCHIGKSVVSEYLSGDRPLARTFVHKFEHAFKIKLQDVATYMDLSWADELIHNKTAVVHPDAFIASYVFFKQMLMARDLVIEGQKNVIAGMTKANEMLMSVYVTQELRIVSQVMAGTHYGKDLGKRSKVK